MRFWLITLYIVLMIPLVMAQEDAPGQFRINYDQQVSETITDRAFFDWWRFNGQQGDIIVVEMTGADGLAPLIGLLDPNASLLTSSDETRVMGANETAVLQYTLPEDGLYTIVATRNGIDQGDTIGSYTLTLQRVNLQPSEDESRYVEVEFRCSELIVTTAAILSFDEDVRISPDTPDGQITEFYRMTVVGLDGFQPVIRVEAPNINPDNYLDCSDDAQAMVNSTYTLPDGSIGIITEDTLDSAAQLTLTNSGPGNSFGELNFTVGSKDGASGRYMAVMEGLNIADARQVDIVALRQGPLAHGTNLQVYMVGAANSRLDPFMMWESEEGDILASCDDANRRGCEGMPSFADAGITFFEENTVQIIGDRFDAGLRFNTDTTEPIFINLMSRENNTHGDYALVIIGELP